jgi:hypothetical protein
MSVSCIVTPSEQPFIFVSVIDITGQSLDRSVSDPYLCFRRLGTIFYISYLAFEFPQNLALQRFPVAKWMRSVPSHIIFVFLL